MYATIHLCLFCFYACMHVWKDRGLCAYTSTYRSTCCVHVRVYAKPLYIDPMSWTRNKTHLNKLFLCVCQSNRLC